MEKVQLQLEGTLPELKDLHDKGLFSKNEIHQITKRRTTFETALVRRVARKEDYFKYAEYEINLEQLRKVRWKRLGYDRNPPPPSASTYSFPRRIMYILKRATAKFSGDLSVWLAYVEYASREGMRKVVASGLTSALQHHPTSSTLYLLSSYHHLHPTAPFPTSIIPSSSSTPLPTAASENEDAPEVGFAIEGTQTARTTLLLGLRMIPNNRDLWREYIKLELGWVEALRRRWKILGIDAGKGKPVSDGELTGEERDGGEGAFGPEGEDARKAILGGQLVIHAIQSSLEKIGPAHRDGEGDGMEFRQSLAEMFRVYPSPLRKTCLEVLYAHLEGVCTEESGTGAKARLMLVTKGLYDREYEAGRKDDGGIVLEGVALVEEYGKIGKEIRKVSKDGLGGWSDIAGDWLVRQTEQLGDNADLARYLLSTVGALCKTSLKPSTKLLLSHIRLLLKLAEPDLLPTARSYAARHPDDPELQLARLRIERSGTPKPEANELRKAFLAATKTCTRSGLTEIQVQATTQIWMEYAAWEESQATDPKLAEATWRKIIRDSLRLAKDVPGVHAALLFGFLNFRLRRGEDSTIVLKDIISTYRPTADFYSAATDHLDAEMDLAVLERLYESWRSSCSIPEQKIDAAINYGSALLRRGKAKMAVDAIDVIRREVREDVGSVAELEGRWKAVLDSAKRSAEQSQDSDSGEEDEEGEEGENGEEGIDVDLLLDL